MGLQTLFRLHAHYPRAQDPSAPVEQQTPTDTVRRGSADSTAPGLINRTAYPLNEEESQLSSRRRAHSPLSPMAKNKYQIPSGAVRAPSCYFSPTRDGATRLGTMGPDSYRAPGAQWSHQSTLQHPHTAIVATDGSAPPVLILHVV